MTSEIKALLKKLGLPHSADLSEEDRALIEERIGDHLTLHCLDHNAEPNEEGRLCEAILDQIDIL